MISLGAIWHTSAVLGQQAVQCTATQKDGSAKWECTGMIDLKGPVTIKIKNSAKGDHGFAIDTMKVYEILKPGEERTITVPIENIVKTVPQHFVYCHNHGEPHMFATIKVAGNK
jgi:hypothetical protein